MIQRDNMGQEVKLGLLTREVLERYMDKDQYKDYIDNALTLYKYYNVLDKDQCHPFSEWFVLEKGWRVPNE
ncbi:hypothetical protein M3611_23670 [Priestia megaterium]|uniref:hypothetical protein n=1 Tax=Priestia megaterium TaxID=1404 RepID=UPI00203BB40E|nr:hypothetical protein [Priestia megaterium]MCM3155014.1 hypothetical protein [Priestia megaterium]